MKKIICYICYLAILFIISILPVSARDIKTCIRTETNLHVQDGLYHKNNLNDILTTPCVDDMDKVYDFADLLTDIEEDNLYNQVKEYISDTNYDLALVTTNENPKNSAMAYADDFFDYNGFGKNETRDGIVILIDMLNRELYVSTSGYAIVLYDDFRIERILDSGYSYITKEDYFNTFSSMIDTMSNYYDLGFPGDNLDIEIDEFGNVTYIKYMPYQLIFVISIIITIIVPIVLYNKSRLKIKSISVISYLRLNKLTVKKDELINTYVNKRRRETSSSSGRYSGRSSSGGGGSSYHTSSSGRSHGGGGRRF